MTLPHALPTTIRALGLAAALCLGAGCGGGGGGGVVAAPASEPAAAALALPAPDPAELVPPDELLANGSFALGLSPWATQNATLVASALRPGGRMLSIGGWALQRIAADRLVPGRSYKLRVKARLEAASAPAQLSLRFRRPAGEEVFRSYPATVLSTTWQDVLLEFTAPAYVAMAELTVTAGAARVLVDAASLVAREPIAPTEAVWTQVGSYVPPGYVLAFNDEFNGPALNRSKWFTRYIQAGGTLDRLSGEQQRYRDNNNHSISNGILSLTARKVSSGDPEGINYESGMLRSDWTARHGYFEARVKMPRGIGLWPAFWLVSDVSASGALGWPPEIDIFEFVNNGVEDRPHMLHSGVVAHAGSPSLLSYADPAFNTTWTYYAAPFNFDEGWHTVGAEWDATSVTVYVDGRRIYTRSYLWKFPDGSAAGPAHILLNLAVGGPWAGRHGIDDAALPQSLQINWVRAYRKSP
jgi:beta-glucanase (GH16 family)